MEVAKNCVQLYLDLMKKILINIIYEDPPIRTFGNSPGSETYDGNPRLDGRDWPSVAHTMVGLKRLDNLHHCVETVLVDGVPGDLVETGVWRGGACIFMRSVLRAYDVKDRLVWVADSFEGMPETTEEHNSCEREIRLHQFNDVLAVPLETVRRNFERYGLLDDQVKFLPGWFKDTLPTAPIERLAVMRLDGDLYGSTMDALVNLYPKLSPGGFVIVDDYAFTFCRDAVHDFRDRNGIEDPIQNIDGGAVYWRRGEAADRVQSPTVIRNSATQPRTTI